MDLNAGDTMTSLGWPDPHCERVTREGLVGSTREATAIFQGQESGLCSKLLQGFMPTKDRTECAFQRDDYGDSVGLELEGGKTGVRRESSRRIAEQFKGEMMSPALLRIYPRQCRSTPNHLG